MKRDKTTFLGNKVDILDKFTTEFDEGPSTSEPEAASASQPEAAPTPVKAAVPIPSAPGLFVPTVFRKPQEKGVQRDVLFGRVPLVCSSYHGCQMCFQCVF